jgi:hypothetical protein
VTRVSRDTVRLVAFSDGVFAITIALLILEIKPPTDDEESLLHGLLELWPPSLAYAADGRGVPSVRHLGPRRRLRSGHDKRTAVAFYGIVFNAFFWLPIRGESPG